MIRRIFIILLIMTIIFTGCNNMDNNQPSNDATYKRINAKQAKEFMESEDVIILDVRTLEEYNAGHIENAVLLPVTDISNKGEEILSNKDSKILVYCRSGNRSATASKQLIKMGYTNVYDFGGILSWPYEIVK